MANPTYNGWPKDHPGLRWSSLAVFDGRTFPLSESWLLSHLYYINLYHFFLPCIQDLTFYFIHLHCVFEAEEWSTTTISHKAPQFVHLCGSTLLTIHTSTGWLESNEKQHASSIEWLNQPRTQTSTRASSRNLAKIYIDQPSHQQEEVRKIKPSRTNCSSPKIRKSRSFVFQNIFHFNQNQLKDHRICQSPEVAKTITLLCHRAK